MQCKSRKYEVWEFICPTYSRKYQNYKGNRLKLQTAHETEAKVSCLHMWFKAVA